ncbi:MAG TPA: tellurite resistance TerB family protein [Lamprocystis sp. (in: g-proteobacteria)]|nr:tellurite resistance TerB family protein [Lamprocystis sp. (in: g-proteobacteria)]
MNALDILGAVMQSGMSPQAGSRMGDVLGQMMGQMTGGAPAGAPGVGQAGAPGGGIFDVLSKVAGSVLGGQGSAPSAGSLGGFPTEILKQVAGAMLGGSGSGGNADAGLGSMAVFGTLAAQALEMAKGMFAGGQAQAGGLPNLKMDDQTAILTGLRPPASPQEQQQLMDAAMLTLRAMISAAKADGQVDAQERERLLGKLNEGGISPEEQRFVAEEMARPIDLDALTRGVNTPQVAAQIYTASLMAITVDSDAERLYLTDLATKLKLDPQVVAYLHKAVGLS